MVRLSITIAISVFFAIVTIFVFAYWLDLPLHNISTGPEKNNLLVLVSLVVAIVTFGIAAITHDRNQKSVNALTVLQALRTDKDYLDRAKIVADRVGGFSKPIDAETLLILKAPKQAPDTKCDTCGRSISNLVNEDFSYAVDFLLNQYEFIATGVRLGAIDIKMIEQTAKSTILGLARAFEPYMLYERQRSPTYWQNLAWLCGKYDSKNWHPKLGRLGPRP